MLSTVDTVTISKEEYEALLQVSQVTNEYLQGKKESFTSSEDLIANLKSL